MSTDVRISPDVIVIISLWRNTMWTQYCGALERCKEVSYFNFIWNNLNLLLSKQPSFTDRIDMAIALMCSLFSSDLYSERNVYWFLKTNSSVEWDCLEEKHTWKRRMPQSYIFKTVQRSKNLFFIIKNVFLDGVGSLKCSILEWGHWCLQCTLSWSDHN